MLTIFVVDAGDFQRVGKLVMADNSLFFKLMKPFRVSRAFNFLNDLHIGDGQLKQALFHPATSYFAGL